MKKSIWSKPTKSNPKMQPKKKSAWAGKFFEDGRSIKDTLNEERRLNRELKAEQKRLKASLAQKQSLAKSRMNPSRAKSEADNSTNLKSRR